MSESKKMLSILKNADQDINKESRKEIKEIWKRIPSGDPAQSIEVSDRQISQSYRNIKKEIHSGRNPMTSETRGTFLKYAAAAVFLLFAIGLTYILIPVSVSVPHGQTQSITLPDESTVQLNSGSQITYSRLFGILERKVSLRGEAFFDVQSDGSPFRVSTPNATVKVLGTKFNVRYWPTEINNRTSVFLTEGTVIFGSMLSDSNSVILQPGEHSWISNKQQNPAEPVKIEKEKAMAWQDNGIAFEDQPLSVIFAELERRFDITINESPDIRNEKITIYLSEIKNSESALNDICRAKGLIYKKQNGKFLIYRR